MAIYDPLEELARRIAAGWFAGAERLKVSNVEAARMDGHFIEWRLGLFSSFAELRLHEDALDPNRYCVTASRVRRSGPPTVEEATQRLEERRPQEASYDYLLPRPAEVTEAEALFLEEHSLMIKTGRQFCSIKRMWSTLTEQEVRSGYEQVLNHVKQLSHDDQLASQ